MKEFKGTPGPWQQSHRERKDGMYATEVYCSEGKTIATLSWYAKPTVDGVTGTYRGENAQLIASAPELLEACQEALKELEFHNWHNTKTGFILNQAISKALGE